MNTTPLAQLTSLQNKIALVTGAAAGIGLATAHRLAEAGASLVLLDRDEAGLAKAADELGTYSVDLATHTVDLADPEAISAFWDGLTELPDILVNNAGIFSSRELGQIDANYVHAMVQINLVALLTMCQQFITKRGKNGGTIVNVSSIEARSAITTDMVLYGATKAGVLGLTRGLTRDHTKRGFKINSVLPGGVMTPGANNVGKQALKALKFSIVTDGIKFKSRLPIGRFAEADDIARVILFLSCPLSDYMCGSEVVVDGGVLAV